MADSKIQLLPLLHSEWAWFNGHGQYFLITDNQTFWQTDSFKKQLQILKNLWTKGEKKVLLTTKVSRLYTYLSYIAYPRPSQLTIKWVLVAMITKIKLTLVINYTYLIVHWSVRTIAQSDDFIHCQQQDSSFFDIISLKSINVCYKELLKIHWMPQLYTCRVIVVSGFSYLMRCYATSIISTEHELV